MRDSRGGMIERVFDSLADARAFKNKIDYEKQSGVDINRTAARATFADYAEDWRMRQPQHKASTRRVVVFPAPLRPTRPTRSPW